MTPELTVVGMMAAGITALFGYIVKRQGDEIAWLRTQLDSWTQIGRSAVTTTEALTKSKETVR